MTQTTHSRSYPFMPTLYIGMELSSEKWKLAFSDGGRRVRERTVPYGNFKRLCWEMERARKVYGFAGSSRVVFCQEAGRDGFWIHRELEAMGFESMVIDPSSVRVSQKNRRPKTDALDARLLVRELVRYDRYDEEAWSVVRVPTMEEEDARRPIRELNRLTKELGQHVTRVKSLLALHGVEAGSMVALEGRVRTLKDRKGRPFPRRLKAEIERELQRWRLARTQLQQIEAEQRAEVREGETELARVVAKLQRLRGIGVRTAWMTGAEVFSWRTFRNRKEVGALAGLCGSPFNTGKSEREQGITKAGSRRLRALLIEVAWAWVTKWQPDSDLTLWYQRRWAQDGRRKKAGIVAVARRLLIELWHYVEHDVVPKGAILQEA